MPTSAESQFVLVCTREPDADTPAELRRAAGLVHNWGLVVELAERHGVAAFVRRGAIDQELAVPDDVRSRLQVLTVAAMARSLQLDNELQRITTALLQEELRIIVLKGPALVRTIYSNVADRPYTDIDLVVQERDEEAVAAVLRRLDFAEHSFVAQDWWRTHGHHIHQGAAFHRTFAGSAQVLIELHADPLQLGLRSVCEMARWQRALPVPHVPGALMLAPEDQLVQLSVHLHKHGFSRLIWIKDLDLLLRTLPTCFDWDVVESDARAEGVTTSVWHSLRLAQQLLRTPVPREALARLRPPLLSRALDRLVWPTVRTSALEGTMRRRAVQFDAAESWRGMLPGLVLMGRRRDRARALLSWILARPRRSGTHESAPPARQ